MGCSNDFLAVKGSISVGAQGDFQQTKHGLQRKDSLVFAAPAPSCDQLISLIIIFNHRTISI
jgi:hypothetical protein